MNDMDTQIAETVSDVTSGLPVRSLVVAFAAGAVASAATAGGTYLVRKYLKARKVAQIALEHAESDTTVV